jgi:hypothetical protein
MTHFKETEQPLKLDGGESVEDAKITGDTPWRAHGKLYIMAPSVLWELWEH